MFDNCFNISQKSQGVPANFSGFFTDIKFINQSSADELIMTPVIEKNNIKS